MERKYECRFDFQEVQGGAIITEYDEGSQIVSVAEDDNIEHSLGQLLYAEITEGARLVDAKVTIIIEAL